MRSAISIGVLVAVVSGCGSTGIVKLEENKYMISEKNAKVGFVNAAEEKAAVYQEANAYCAKQGKEVKTLNLEMRNSGFARSASATLEFSCVTAP
ncbi:MAG: hypothetical protein Q8L69_10425 [Gallionellaceae bacterium]|nr:hypothetical protein [Gallionellaceae bacterium]